MSATPRSLVLDLFGDYLRYTGAGHGGHGGHGGRVHLGRLVRLLGDFDVAPATVRVTLSRLRREEWFTTAKDGRETVYQLSPAMLAVLEEGRQRIFAPPAPPWDGTWTMLIYGLGEAERSDRDELRRTLAWHGFGPMATSTWLAPGDRRAEIEAATASVVARPEEQLDVFTCASRGLEHDRALAARCWDLPALELQYRTFLEEHAALAAAPAALEGAAALVARTELVSRFRHFPFSDPRLPAELCPAGWPGEQARELFVSTHAALGPAARAYVGEVLGEPVAEPKATSLV